MGSDWRRLGRALAQAREEMGLTQHDVKDRLGVSLNPVQTIERGASKRITTTIRAYARLVGWTDDSPEKVLEGGEPALRADNEPPAIDPAVASRLDEFPDDVRKAILEGGEVFDATVVDVDLPDIPGEMIIVVQGKPVAPPAVMARDLTDIAKRYLRLRGITPPGEGDDSNGSDDAAEA